jgi:hypothetical protein
VSGTATVSHQGRVSPSSSSRSASVGLNLVLGENADQFPGGVAAGQQAYGAGLPGVAQPHMRPFVKQQGRDRLIDLENDAWRAIPC